MDAAERHALTVRAAVAAARGPVLVSHMSAAVLHGLPVVGVRDQRVHLTVAGASGGEMRAFVARHATEGPVAETVVGGVRVTTAARTVVDLARGSGFLAGVAAGDAALRLRRATMNELRDEVEAAGHGRGVRTARDVLAFVDERSGSAGESLSRVRMWEAGLATPDLQREFHDRQGFVGRVDFWWEDLRVVGEFDGRSKYGIDGESQDVRDQLWDEKIREDRLRAVVSRVVRWTWAEAWAGAPLVARLREAGVR